MSEKILSLPLSLCSLPLSASLPYSSSPVIPAPTRRTPARGLSARCMLAFCAGVARAISPAARKVGLFRSVFFLASVWVVDVLGLFVILLLFLL